MVRVVDEVEDVGVAQDLLEQAHLKRQILFREIHLTYKMIKVQV